MQNEMSKLVLIVQDLNIPTQKMHTTAPNMVAAKLAELENQFLIHSTEEQLLTLSTYENQFLMRHDSNQLATAQAGDQFPIWQTLADMLKENILDKNLYHSQMQLVRVSLLRISIMECQIFHFQLLLSSRERGCILWRMKL